ncbi:unnamed protein product [Parnassius apollo]|uniref:(apollo) hypothetical protein n=1 Tax=Parnassius apollo TaxID=110799 RepID=A0A8S3WK11_PARAO|nr:unnamed protein product [Parnassius apollo]
MPPDPAIVSDEEEGNEDDLSSTTFPRDVPGTVEIAPLHPNHDVSEWDDSDNEPLSTHSRPAKRARRRDSNEPVWRKTLPLYSMTHDVTGIIQRRQEVLVESLKDCSPVMLFEKIFDDNVMSLIVKYSMKYAGQHNRHSFEIDKPELRTFLAILCFTGYHELPSERAYWSLDEDLGVPLIANCISRNRFFGH